MLLQSFTVLSSRNLLSFLVPHQVVILLLFSKTTHTLLITLAMDNPLTKTKLFLFHLPLLDSSSTFILSLLFLKLALKSHYISTFQKLDPRTLMTQLDLSFMLILNFYKILLQATFKEKYTSCPYNF